MESAKQQENMGLRANGTFVIAGNSKMASDETCVVKIVRNRQSALRKTRRVLSKYWSKDGGFRRKLGRSSIIIGIFIYKKKIIISSLIFIQTNKTTNSRVVALDSLSSAVLDCQTCAVLVAEAEVQ